MKYTFENQICFKGTSCKISKRWYQFPFAQVHNFVFCWPYKGKYLDHKMSIFGWTYTKIGTIQRRLAWPLRKDDTQNREAFHIFWSALTSALIQNCC